MEGTPYAAGAILADRYRVVRMLGQGGTGMVLEVRHLELEGRHALKLLHASNVGEAELVARFENEARLAATMRSEHLVRVTDMGRLRGGEPFLVMDYLDGADLDQLIARNGQLPIPTAVSWVLQASLGLAHLHAAGVVHRDIKPSNLFLAREPDGREIVKVLDFGLAKAPASSSQRLTSTRANFGTPQFMAPEQIVSAKNVDARCDQHALGLVLYELLVGEPAFVGETAGAITVAIATEPAPPVRAKRTDVPEELGAAVAKALAKKPHERYGSLAEWAAAIAPFGPPDAHEVARSIARLLGSARSTEPLGRSRDAISYATSAPRVDDSPTLLGAPDFTARGLATTNRSTRRPALAIGFSMVAFVVFAAVAAFFVAGRRGGAARDGSVSAVSETSADPSASSLATTVEPRVEALPSVATAVGSIPSPAGASASASASAIAEARPKLRKPPPAQRPSAKPTSIFEKYK